MIPFSEFSASREKRERPERKKPKVRFLVPGMLWILFSVSFGYILFFSQETIIRDISFSGNETIPLALLETEADRAMQGKHFRVFPKNNFFFIPKETLAADMRNISPKIREVAIRRTFPSRMDILVRERPVAIIWRSANGDFLLDEYGFASDHPNLSIAYDAPFSFLLHDEAGRETAARDMVMGKDIPLFIGEFALKFESRFGKALSREVRVTSRFSGELLFHAEEGFDILLDSRFAPEDTLITLQAAMERGITEEDRKHLSRIDLRTENRVYYTLKAKTSDEAVSPEETKKESADSSEKKKK